MAEIPKISFKKGPRIEGFELLDLEELMSRSEDGYSHDPRKPHRVDFFALFLIQAGKASHWVDFETRELHPGDALIVSKNQVHAFDPQGDYQGHLVLFTEEFLLQYFPPTTVQKTPRLYNYHLSPSAYHCPDENQWLVQNLLHELKSTPIDVLPHIVAAILAIYLLKLEAGNQDRGREFAFDRRYEIFERFKSLLETGFARTRNASDYARDLGITYKHLNEICKHFTHRTAKAFVDDHVILECKRLLASSTLAVKEVCFQCGFDELTNFHKYFRKIEGKTPTEFRNNFH